MMQEIVPALAELKCCPVAPLRALILSAKRLVGLKLIGSTPEI